MFDRCYSASTPMVDRLLLFSRWVKEGHAHILRSDLDPSVAGTIGPMVPNDFQVALFGEMLKQARAGLPIRGIVLKPRKLGSSTFDVVLKSFMAKYFTDWTTRILSHSDDSTTDIFETVVRLLACEKTGPQPVSEIGAKPVRFPHRSIIDTRTAGGRYVSTGATVNALVLSEISKWPGTITRLKSTLASLFNSMYDRPNTMVTIESTANMDDDTEVFENYWNSFGEPDSPYFRLFWPWFKDRNNVADVPDDFVVRDDEERELVAKFNLTPAQLMFRRNKLYALGETLFRQDFPSTPVEAFQRPQGRVFPQFDANAMHVRHEINDLKKAGYRFYGGVDMGATDAWVALIAAHKPGLSRMTVDAGNCPNFCREMTGWRWMTGGRPGKKNDHTCEAARYAITHWGLTGHVHFLREYYNPESVAKGQNIPYHAERVRELTTDITDCVFACSRERPDSISFLNQNGVRAVSFRSALAERRGEVLDGIEHMNTLIGSTGFLVRQKIEKPESVAAQETARLLGLPSSDPRKRKKKTGGRFAALRRF